MKKSGTKLSTRPKSTTHNLQEISQLWKVTEAAWHERNQALHNGKNKLTSQSEYNEKMKKYYQHKGEILRRDEHFLAPLRRICWNQNWEKIRFLERAKYLFEASKAGMEKVQISVSSYYQSTIKETKERQQQGVGIQRKSFAQPINTCHPILWLTWTVHSKEMIQEKCYQNFFTLLLHKEVTTHQPFHWQT